MSRTMSGLGGNAVLTAGTATAPQTFTGFNKFDELTEFETTRPQLVSTAATSNPSNNDFITKTDGEDLFGSITGSALLAGGETAEEPQTFTGFNQFDELTKYNIIRPQLVGTASPATPANTDFITKADGEALFTNNTGDVTLNGANAFTGTNTFNYNRPTSDLTSTPDATDFITKADGDNLYTNNTGDVTLNGANAFTGTNTFNYNRPTSDLTSTPDATDFITKADGDNLYGGGGSGDALLDGGTEALPQTFTGFNKFEEDVELEGYLNLSSTSNRINQTGGGDNEFNQTGFTSNRLEQNGLNNGITQSSSETSGSAITNFIYQTGGTNNNITQFGSNSLIKTGGKIVIGTAPTITPTSNFQLQVRGGIYVDGEEGIRIPRRGLYDQTGYREWRIDHYSGGASAQSGVNCLTFAFSAFSGGYAPGLFFVRARLQSNGRLELASTLLTNQTFVISDDRLKTNEVYLENATESLLKLSVQTYDKEKVNNFNLEERTGIKVRETGLIAQEVYYNAPEFRNLISAGTVFEDECDLSGNPIGDYDPEGREIIPDEMDLSGVPIGSDPDYEGAGWSKTSVASVGYGGFIPYLIKSNQELHKRISILEAKVNNM